MTSDMTSDMSNDAAPLSARAVTVDRGGVTVVDGVSVDAHRGQWLTMIGPNGAGKTSLLLALAGLIDHGGAIHVGGGPVERLGRRQRAQRVALVPQHPVIPLGMTVSDYVALGRTAHLPLVGAPSTRDQRVVDDILDRLELRRFAARGVTTLSGGERQRCLLARALAQEAGLVLLDEPTTGLDIGHQTQVLDVVDDLRAERGLTVVATMHDLTLAGRHADRLLLLAEGRVVAAGAPAEVLDAGVLSACYGAPVRVIHDQGTVVVVPAAPVPKKAGSVTAGERRGNDG